MTMLVLQILLMMLTAYFAGAALACMLRKLVAPAHRAAPVATGDMRPVEPLPTVQRAEPSPAASRFEKALAAEPPRPVVEAAAAAVPPPPRVAPAERIAAPPPTVARAPHPPVEAPHPSLAAELVVPPPPRITLTAPPVAPEAPSAAPIAIAAVTAAAAVAAVQAASTSAKPAQAVATAAVAPAVDDLTRIRGIDARMAAALRDLGVTRYRDIAGWMRSDVSRVNQALGLKNRVERDNWIEQAQMLAAGGETYFTRQRIRQQATAPLPMSQPVRAAQPSMPSAAPVAASSVADVPGVAAVIAAAAAATAVKTANPPAAAPSAPASAVVAAVPVPTPSPARVEERAAFATLTPSVLTPSPSVAPVPPPPRAAEPAPLPSAQPIRPQAAPTRDQLQRISGINAEIEKLLNVQGVTRYAQIAAWGTVEVDRFDRLLGAPGRVRRESWIEQAQMLAKGGETSGARPATVVAPAAVAPVVAPPSVIPAAPAVSAPPATAAAAAAAAAAALAAAAAAAARPVRLQDAIQAQSAVAPPPAVVEAPAVPVAPPPRTDLSGLRSVKSEAFQSTAGAHRRGSHDDLKRVRGIGVLIEKRLNALGVTSYDQIANWTSDDIARFSQQLDFKGRIERENWVEQARILAAGGFTEFSRRVDRGDVDSSRTRQ